VLGDYLTGEMGCLDRVGRGVRDSSPDNQRVGTGASSDKYIFTKIKEKTCIPDEHRLYYT